MTVITRPVPELPASGTAQAPDLIQVLEQRRSVEPAFLGGPGPSAEETRRILQVAARVPDHGMLVPWRFVLIRGEARAVTGQRLADAYAASMDAAQPGWRDDLRAAGKHEKLGRLMTYAPLIVAVVSTADPAASKPEWEQVLTAGAVCMNLVTAATALGYGAVWLTGFPAYDPAARAMLGIRPEEKVAGLIHVGTASKRPADRRRPDLDAITTEWTP